MLERLASFCFHRRRIVLIAWICALPLAFGLATAAGGSFSSQQGGDLPNSDSQKAFNLVERAFPEASGELTGANGQVVFMAEGGVASKKAEIETFLAKLRAKDKIVKSIVSPFDSPQPRISQDC
jgi:putative drug exporter of the RND superfamily